jgi:hypothetical protein
VTMYGNVCGFVLYLMTWICPQKSKNARFTSVFQLSYVGGFVSLDTSVGRQELVPLYDRTWVLNRNQRSSYEAAMLCE